MIKYNNKKGAMFGLDARIALAIFGALSVISGAALFSAIQDAKVTAMVVSFENIAKSYEAFYIDTGVHDKHGCHLNTNVPAIAGWKGPYTNTKPEADCNGTPGIALNDPFYNAISTSSSYYGEKVVSGAGVFSPFKGQAWASSVTACPDDNDCVIYYVHKIPGNNSDSAVFNSLAAALDEKIDGGDGNLAGKFRYLGGVLPQWFYQIMPD